jgi:DNA polymerase-3 subunit alpha
MALPRFVHLRLHSEFSITDGVVRIDDVVAAAAKDEMGALALTDLSNLFGLVRFYTAARSGGIKPIAGADVWISNPQEPDQPYRLLLLVQNHSGYLNLCQLLSRASLDNQTRGRAEVDMAWFSEPAAKAEDKAAKRTLAFGLIALSGGRIGEVGAALLAGQEDQAKQAAKRLSKIFPQSFYIEVQRGGHPQDEKYIQLACHLAGELDLPVVATHPVQFMQKSDFTAHEARVCIAEGELLGNPRRQKKFNDEQYFLSQAEMEKRFADLPVALANSVEIAKRCNLSLVLGQPRLPDFPVPKGVTLDEYLLAQSEVGLKRHMERNFPDPEERAKEEQR